MHPGQPPSAEAIKTFIAKQLGRSADALSDDQLLAANLGVSRERAEALFAALASTFGLKGEIEFERYFEGFRGGLQMAEFSPILRALYPRLREQWRTAPPRPDISVGHLVHSVQIGMWTEPPPLTPPEPLVWVGKKILTPIIKAGVFLLYALSYVIAAGFIGMLIGQLVGAMGDALRGYWVGVVYRAIPIIFWGFIVLLMAENTQRAVRARFGLLWDWRRGRLREPRPEPIGQRR
jgi:hypothetical protein